MSLNSFQSSILFHDEPTFRGLLLAMLKEPEDSTHRLVLADWLLDHDEPERASILQVVPKLIEAPPREGYAENRWTVPNIVRVLPPTESPSVPITRRGTWRGVHQLGRLLSIAFVRTTLQLPWFQEHPVLKELADAIRLDLQLLEFYHCGLTLKLPQVDLQVHHESAVLGIIIRACRKYAFGAYVTVAARLCDWSFWLIRRTVGYQFSWLEWRETYYRFLGMVDRFAEIAPWDEMRRLNLLKSELRRKLRQRSRRDQLDELELCSPDCWMTDC